APKLQEFSRGQIIQRALRHLDTSQTRLLIGQRLARGVDPHTQIKLRVLVNRHQKCMRIAGKCLGDQFPDLLRSRTHRSLTPNGARVRLALLTPARLRTSCCAHVYSSLSLAIQTLDSVSRHAAVSSVASKNS